jgi:hypothetical protein
MEDVKIIGQNVFVFDNIKQALSICHVFAYIYLLLLLARPWKHLTKHVYLHTLIVQYLKDTIIRFCTSLMYIDNKHNLQDLINIGQGTNDPTYKLIGFMYGKHYN